MTKLEHVIARNIAELREEKGATQADLAAKMRANGFAWQTNRAAQIETLRRPVSLLEVVGLARVFFVPVGRLLEGSDEVDMPDGSAMPLAEVRDALAGKGAVTVRDATPDEVAEHHDAAEDLAKLAKRVGVTPHVLDALAYRVFGQSLRAEREQRVGDVSDLPKRSAQTKRGHATRQILTLIEDYLGQDRAVVAEIEEKVDRNMQSPIRAGKPATRGKYYTPASSTKARKSPASARATGSKVKK